MLKSIFKNYLRRVDHRGKLRLTNVISATFGLSYVHETRYGTFVVHPEDTIDRHIVAVDGWEPLTTERIIALCREHGAFVDLGAHVGWFSIAVANSLKNCRVVALEANSRTFERLLVNLGRNQLKNVTPILGAFGNDAELVTMCPGSKHNTGASAIRYYETSKGDKSLAPNLTRIIHEAA